MHHVRRRHVPAALLALFLTPTSSPAEPTAPAPQVRGVWLPVPVEALHPGARDKVGRVLRQPTVLAASKGEEFASTPEFYQWLLDHPDRVSLGWRRLRVPCVEIVPLGDGRFRWQDANGSELTWQTVARTAAGRVWYAEGEVDVGLLLPKVPVRAVAVLRHAYGSEDPRRPTVRHSVEVYLQTDSRAAALAMKLLGPAAPRMAEQAAGQLLLFFSGIARKLEKQPEKASALLANRPS
jgi:hypothetical protein